MPGGRGVVPIQTKRDHVTIGTAGSHSGPSGHPRDLVGSIICNTLFGMYVMYNAF